MDSPRSGSGKEMVAQNIRNRTAKQPDFVARLAGLAARDR
jgi:hypothetical protein